MCKRRCLDNTGINGEKIRRMRLAFNLSQSDLALEIDTEQQVISKIERNQDPYITLQLASRLADFFQVPVDELRDKKTD